MYTDVKKSVFPSPKIFYVRSGEKVIGEQGICGCCISIPENAGNLTNEAAGLIAEKIADKLLVCPVIYTENFGQDGKQLIICFELCESMSELGVPINMTEESYQLEVDDNGIKLKASTGKGHFYAAQTLLQLIYLKDNKLLIPSCKIIDWPDMKHRGLFLEDRYGTDLMKLEDWKATVDYMAALKMNFLGIGLYGCWNIQYGNEISEYLYVPIRKYPDLKTQRTVRYFSEGKKLWKAIKYLPPMFDEDFLSDLISYGKSKNIIIRPQFNSLGHNTLIPRLYTEISARDVQGNATGFGLCLSEEKTYEMLFSIYNEIIDRYLAPNGIDYFHMGLDEVIEMIGIDPDEPFKKFGPWCQCEHCSQLSNEEHFINHIIKLASYLKLKGIRNIFMWHDQLLKMGLLNDDFVKRLKAEGLNELVVLSWWRYGPAVFETIKPELGLRTFITPMAGYYHWSLTNSYLTNISKMLTLGHRDGAEGAEAYCIFDYSYDRNYCCLSEYSWNTPGEEGLNIFREHYIKKNFAMHYEMATKAFRYFDSFVEPGEKFQTVFILLSYYHYTYVREGKDYPRNFPGEAFEKLYEDVPKYLGILKEVREESTIARNIFEELSQTLQYDYRLLKLYKTGCQVYQVVTDEFITLVELFEGGTLDFCASSVERLLEIKEKLTALGLQRRKLMLDIEMTKEHYLLPSELRNFSIYMQYLEDLETYIGNLAENLKNGIQPEKSVLNIKDTRNIQNALLKLIR